MSITVVLWEPISEMNLGLVVRACYVLGQGRARLAVYDPNGLTIRCWESIRRFSSYSADHFKDMRVFPADHEVRSMLAEPDGRTIAATPNEIGAATLAEFRFAPRDRIVFGNEYYGLPSQVVTAAEHRVTIPMLGPAYERPNPGSRITAVGSHNCLSLISSVSIILYAALSDTARYS